jgi:hypothetical protein
MDVASPACNPRLYFFQMSSIPAVIIVSSVPTRMAGSYDLAFLWCLDLESSRTWTASA